jgi:hypothetical protein
MCRTLWKVRIGLIPRRKLARATGSIANGSNLPSLVRCHVARDRISLLPHLATFYPVLIIVRGRNFRLLQRPASQLHVSTLLRIEHQPKHRTQSCIDGPRAAPVRQAACGQQDCPTNCMAREVPKAHIGCEYSHHVVPAEPRHLLPPPGETRTCPPGPAPHHASMVYSPLLHLLLAVLLVYGNSTTVITLLAYVP